MSEKRVRCTYTLPPNLIARVCAVVDVLYVERPRAVADELYICPPVPPMSRIVEQALEEWLATRQPSTGEQLRAERRAKLADGANDLCDVYEVADLPNGGTA